MQQLSSFRWPGLDAAVYRLYQRAVAAKPQDLGERLGRDDLALACAERLLGKGHDGEFRTFFAARVRQARSDLGVAKKNEKSLPRGYAGYGPALSQRIEIYGSFLKRLFEELYLALINAHWDDPELARTVASGADAEVLPALIAYFRHRHWTRRPEAARLTNEDMK